MSILPKLIHKRCNSNKNSRGFFYNTEEANVTIHEEESMFKNKAPKWETRSTRFK